MQKIEKLRLKAPSQGEKQWEARSRSGLQPLPSSRGWGWCSARSWGWCFGAWPSAWSGTPCRAAPPCGTCPSWSCRQSQRLSRWCPWPGPAPRCDPLAGTREKASVTPGCQGGRGHGSSGSRSWGTTPRVPAGQRWGHCAQARGPKATNSSSTGVQLREGQAEISSSLLAVLHDHESRFLYLSQLYTSQLAGSFLSEFLQCTIFLGWTFGITHLCMKSHLRRWDRINLSLIHVLIEICRIGK